MNLGKWIIGGMIGGAVGAAIWAGISYATNYEIGWIAWGVGIAAGFGMMIGYNGTSVSAGGVAAMLAVGGILLGKWMVFSVVLSQTMALLDNPAHTIKLDVTKYSPDELEKRISDLKKYRSKILAEKVDTYDDLEFCKSSCWVGNCDIYIFGHRL